MIFVIALSVFVVFILFVGICATVLYLFGAWVGTICREAWNFDGEG